MKIQIEYKEENGLLIPQIETPNLMNLGKYGTIFKNYLKEEKGHKYSRLMICGTIETTLNELNLEATRKIINLTDKMFETSSYKNSMDTMEIYQEKESLKRMAEEIILKEIMENI